MPGPGQRLPQRADHQAAHEAGVAEAHLGLGRMDVDVDLRRRAGEVERRGRVPVARQHVGVGRAQRAEQQPVAHRPAVDREVLRHRRAARVGGQRREAGQPEARRASASTGSAFSTNSGAEHRAQPAAQPVEQIARLGVEAQDLARRVRDRRRRAA